MEQQPEGGEEIGAPFIADTTYMVQTDEVEGEPIFTQELINLRSLKNKFPL